ncbi:glycosyltransferase family 4 protein [Pseudonocardia sp. Cha107L01]|uniref:glycosyltransferase family 4 protein n=1 Tax=Pseudonocardia sp. Cha107L01 TaxID=3457576 RepID=UPI00403EE504
MKIAWLTNVQAPYREPMWREIASLVDLKVSFLFREEKIRHWEWRDANGYSSSIVGTRQVPLPGSVSRRLDEPRLAILRPGVAADILQGADVLVIHEWWQLAYLWCALRARIRGIPYIIYSESTLDSRQFRGGFPAWFRSQVFKHAGAVITPGLSAARAAVANGTAPWRVVESVNSIDLSQFDRRVRELRTGRDTSGQHRFVYVGQLITRKNVAALIRAFAVTTSEDTLVIAGDGVELDALKALARECGVDERVRFLGFLEEPEIVALLSECHTLVLPSTEEVYGFTALEAYVAGLQVIVSNVAGIASNLAGRPGTWIVDPTEAGLGRALREAPERWLGWLEDVDVEELASPRRVAADIIRAVDVAHRNRLDRSATR